MRTMPDGGLARGLVVFLILIWSSWSSCKLIFRTSKTGTKSFHFGDPIASSGCDWLGFGWFDRGDYEQH